MTLNALERISLTVPKPGLELLSVLTANKNALVSCSANDLALSMDFVDRGKLFAAGQSDPLNLTQDYAGQVMKCLSTHNISYHYHHKCLTDQALQVARLDNFYRPLAYSYDKLGMKFIAIMEAIDYPFFGVQFHPEKASYEFVIKHGQHNISHSAKAQVVSRYFADFFVNQARSSSHQTTVKSVERTLIYNYQPMYTGILRDMYEQRYLFPFTNSQNLSTEEFLNRVPVDDSEVSEEVS